MIFQVTKNRRLAYEEYGDSKGKPVFYFHGWPGSRFGAVRMDHYGKKHGYRIISPDRPGVGESDDKKNRTLLDWPDDVTALADYLKLKKFSILGLSGGGPYVLACSYKIPHRLETVIIGAGLGPLYRIAEYPYVSSKTKWLWKLSMRMVDLVSIQLMIMRCVVCSFPNSVLIRLNWHRTDGGRDGIHHLALRHELIDSTRESLKNGIMGCVRDARIYARDWGFRIEDVTIPVYLWHGRKDNRVPDYHARFISSKLKNAKFFSIPDAGHYLLGSHLEQILSSLEG